MLRVYRVLLSLLPRDFRREYGDEMVRVVRRHWEETRRRVGPAGALRFWLRQGRGLARALAESRRGAHAADPIPRRSSPSGVPNPSHRAPLPGKHPESSTRRDRITATFQDLLQDLRHSARSLIQRPAFALVTVLTLALGIGAATTIFSAVYGVLVHPLPYPDADRILTIRHVNAETGVRGNGLSVANARDLGERAETLAVVSAARPYALDLMVDGHVESLRAWRVTRGFFDIAGIEALRGRTFSAAEYEPGSEPVVVVSHATWRARFGADPGLVGEAVVLDGKPMTVIGVLPPEFALPAEAELWIPRPFEPADDRSRDADYMTGLARLAPGAGIEQARAETDRIAASLAETHPDTMATTAFHLQPLRDHLVAAVRTPLLVLLTAVGLVLLIACANVAGLMLARGTERTREYALRSALGASAGRIVRQVCTESLLLAGIGCALGVGLAHLGAGAIRALAPAHLPRIDEIALDPAVLLFAIGITGLTALLAGLAPALRLSRPRLRTALTDGSRGATSGPGSHALRRGLVVVEIAAAVMLLIGAGLLARSFGTLLDRDLGFATDDRLAIQVFAYGYGEETGMTLAGFLDRAVEELEALPGVRQVALTSNLPSATDGVLASIDIDLPFTIPSQPPPPVGREPRALVATVSENYFEIMEIPIVAGRGFDSSDDAAAPEVVVMNEAFARRHFPGTDPVGAEISIGLEEPTPREVIGVVGDVLPGGHESEPKPELYFPLRQEGTGSLTFVVQTDVEAATVTQAARQAIWRANPMQSIWGVATIDRLLADWLEQRRFNLVLLGSFALIALVLAAVGIYGLISYSVQQRTAEMGIRRALGGRTTTILVMVLRQAELMAGIGVALGLIGALLLTRFLRDMLYGVEATDPATFLGLATMVMITTALAALVPAWRATRADPVEALRSQ